MKRFVSLLLLAFASVVPCANAQSVTLTTPDDPVGDAVETTEDTLGDLSQPGSGDSTDSLGTDSPGGTAQDAGDSGTASAGASPGKAFRTRFDRLPPRLETLLERIELGRRVRANLRRLERVLGSVSERERTRLLRLLNAEIRRLRADGVSHEERRRIERLIRTRAALTPQSMPTATSAVANATTGTSGAALAPGMGPRVGTGILRAVAAASTAPPREGAASPRGGAEGPSDDRAEGVFPLTQVLLVLAAVVLAIVGGLAIKEERAT